MLRNRKAISLTVVTLLAAGCARSDFSVSRHDRGTWLPVTNARIAKASEAKPPKVLPETHFAAARLFESQGLFGKAIAQYRKAVAVNHSYVEAYHRLGLLLSITGRHEEALAVLRRAVKLEPNSAILRNNFGFELLLARRWADAEKELSRAIKLNPRFARAHVNLGMTQSKLGRFDDALDSFRAVLPEADAYYNLGLMYRGQQLYDEAATAFQHVLSCDPDFSSAQTQLSQIALYLEPVRISPEPRASARADLRVASHLDKFLEPSAQPESSALPVAPESAELDDSPDEFLALVDEIFAPADKIEPESAVYAIVEETTPADKLQTLRVSETIEWSEVDEPVNVCWLEETDTAVEPLEAVASLVEEPWMEEEPPCPDEFLFLADASHEPDEYTEKPDLQGVASGMDFEEIARTVDTFEADRAIIDAGIEEGIIDTSGLSESNEVVSYTDIEAMMSAVDAADIPMCMIEATAVRPVPVTSSINARAVLQEFEEQLAILRNEIACQEELDAEAEEAVALATWNEARTVAGLTRALDVGPGPLYPTEFIEPMGPPTELAPPRAGLAASQPPDGQRQRKVRLVADKAVVKPSKTAD